MSPRCDYNRRMEIYDQYAQVYDDSGQIAFSLKMVPYLDELLQLHQPPGRSMLDLACGTGTVACSFAVQGWETYAIDRSSGMLSEARAKALQTGQDIAFSQQDMRDFALPRPVDLITCLYDSLNYLLSPDELRKTFCCIHNTLTPGGVFIGDTNTQITLEEIWGNNTFFVESPDVAVVLRSSFEKLTGISGVDIIGFVRQPDGRYARFQEHHLETAQDKDEIRRLLEGAGLVVEAVYECFTLKPVNPKTRRILWVARKPEKP